MEPSHTWQDFEKALTGGHPNSLGNTEAVVAEVLEQPQKVEALYQCYKSTDEVVRVRVSNAMKRLAKAQPELLHPYIDRFLSEVAAIKQASAQWTLAQLILSWRKQLSPEQQQRAVEHLRHNLAFHQDWIVLNTTMETLAHFAKTDTELKTWMKPQIAQLITETRKSVAGRARKTWKALGY